MADAEALHLEVVVAALQDPHSGVRLSVREKNGKMRHCFHGASIRESLKQYGFEDAKRVNELIQRLLDSELMAPFKSSDGGTEFKDDRAYFFVEQIVLSRSYIVENLGKALGYFASTPYKRGAVNSSTIVARRKKDKPTLDLGIFGVDTEAMRAKDRERQERRAAELSMSGVLSPRDNQQQKMNIKQSGVLDSSAGMPSPAVPSASSGASSSASSNSSSLDRSTSAGSAPVVIEADTDEIQFAFNDDDPIPVVKAATLDKLIERLTYEEYIDMRFQLNFMVTFRAFLSPLQLLEKLSDRFNQKETDGPDAQKKRQVRQLRVLAVVSRWVQHYSEPWVVETGDELRKALASFLEQVQPLFPQLARQISDNLHRAQEAAALHRAGLCIQNEPAPATPFVFDDNTVTEAAQQLTLYGSLLFASIQGSELLGQAWSKKGKEEKAANIIRYITNFNRVSGWVVHAICTTINLKQRAAVLVRVITLAQRCRDLSNFHHAMAIFAALVSAPVRRLKGTWGELTAATQDVFKSLETLFSHSSSYKNYREALKDAPLPCVPYLGLALTDLTFIEEGNPEKLKGLLNFQRHMLCAKVLEGIYRLQSVLPKFTRNPAAMHWIQNLKTLAGDEEAYQMSLKIEPRNTVEGIEQMLMEEEKLRARLQTAEVRNAELEAEVTRLKAHIAKLDTDLRAALKGESFDPSKSRTVSGAITTKLADQVRPKWAGFTLRSSNNNIASATSPTLGSPASSDGANSPSPSASPATLLLIGEHGGRTTTGSGRDAATRLPPLATSSPNSPSSPPSSPGRNANNNSAVKPALDWARTRPSPRPATSSGRGALLSSSTGSPEQLELPPPPLPPPPIIDPASESHSPRGNASPVRGGAASPNRRLLLPKAPAPPPSKEAFIAQP